MPSTREKQSKQVGEEILELLSKPTAKERSLVEKFKSQGGAQVMEFCPHGTKAECERQQPSPENLSEDDDNNDDAVDSLDKKTVTITSSDAANKNDGDEIRSTVQLGSDGNANAISNASNKNNGSASSSSSNNNISSNNNNNVNNRCNKLHFKKIIQSHTDEALGDCSFLNTCFHMDTCKYVHYEVDSQPAKNVNNMKLDNVKTNRSVKVPKFKVVDPSTALHPAQWIQCDLRFLDMTVLGKFAVIMADPPWDIHMELPYGTMSDDEMRQLGVPALQDDGLIFLWVTGRAMELGRECLKLWGYERCDELIWVKTNQLQRIIRTGRTGHWLNHGKEHCLIGHKGNPANLNRGLDCDVIVAEVRATSHKPDEIYGIIERLSPGTRKIELFGRPHNVQPNWYIYFVFAL